ncbi:MAG: nicotinate-nucleotide--dimethylbenzimidazole phosphoribosyltransferase [Bacteroidetes bacterium]|nr:nicotinate-nucleotide--dimethylbenzimidazole phosphoribosyltransferase [Bacteroidota bacterium]
MSCLVTLCDHGIGSSAYSRKPHQYTWTMAIRASEGLLPISSQVASVFNVGMSRYFEQLGHVTHGKIGKTLDLLAGDALEPPRMLRGMALGKEQMELIDSPVVYLSDIGSGNDLSAESLVYRLSGNPLVELASPKSQHAEFKDLISQIEIQGTHAFDYLLRLGGYDTAFCFGAITAAAQQGKLVFVEGWSSIAALVLAHKMFPAILDHVWIVSPIQCPVFEYIIQEYPFKVLFKEPSPFEGGFFAPHVRQVLENIASHLLF